MEIVVLTIFPDIFIEYFNSSILKNAQEKKLLNIKVIDFRKFSENKHNKVDGKQIGGGPGMVISALPIINALNNFKNNFSKTILFDPCGKKIDNKLIDNLLNEKQLILICGHYEGIDERIKKYVDIEISIGDFILSGGEIPAMLLVDAIARKIEGVISKDSLSIESFNEDLLLDYPAYTKPVNLFGDFVPDILLSGNHEKIDKYRFEQRLIKTKKYRKDLYNKFKKMEANKYVKSKNK